MESKSPLPRPHLAWIIVWVVIYTAIIICGILIPDSPILTIVKVSGVFLCSIYALAIFPKDRLLQVAMIITFIADCILAKNNVSPTGLIVFFCAQLIHLYRLTRPERRNKIFWLALIGMLIIGLNFWVQLAPPVFVISSFYALTLLLNIIASWRWHRQQRSFFSACALAGFILFSCCDLCTGISYMSLISVFPAFLYIPANFFAWFFYYPSQILVSNSSKCATIDVKEGKC